MSINPSEQDRENWAADIRKSCADLELPADDVAWSNAITRLHTVAADIISTVIQDAALTTTNKKLRDAALRLAVHATGLHVTPVDTDALGDLLKLALKEEE